MNLRPISSDYFADFTEEKCEYDTTTISPFTVQVSTKSLSALVQWFTYPPGVVPFAVTYASYEVLPFNKFNLIITMILPQQEDMGIKTQDKN